MTDTNSYSFSFELTSPISYVNLPVKMNNVKKCKVKSLSYITQTLNNRVLLIKINGWSNNNAFFSTNANQDYTRILPLNGTLNTLNVYLNNDNQFYDVIRTDALANVGQLEIHCKIDGAYNNDISPTNPLLLEIFFTA
jgi:hypothetical protein